MKSRKRSGPEREMPQKIYAEQVVLGTLLNFPEYIEQVIDVLRPQDFYRNFHRDLYELMVRFYHQHGRGADFVTLAESFDQSDQAYEAGAADLADLIHLRNELWSVDLLQDVRLILGASVQRQILHAAQQLATIGYTVDDPEQARQAVEALFAGLLTPLTPASDFEPLADILPRCLTQAEQASKQSGRLTGLATGYHDLDLMTGGFQAADLILLAARPSMGKTSWALNIAYQVAKQGKVVAIFSLEMSKEQLGNRFLSFVSRLPSHDIRSGWLISEQWETLVQAGDHLGEMAVSVDDAPNPPVSSVRSKLRRLQARLHRPIDLVILDYLGLMESEESNTHRENRNQELAQISRGLKGIAREFHVPLLALAQLSRAIEGRQSKIPQLSDLRDSGSLEQDADLVMFIYREESAGDRSVSGPGTPAPSAMANILVAKHRNGPVGTFCLRFNPILTRFDNLEIPPTETEKGETLP